MENRVWRIEYGESSLDSRLDSREDRVWSVNLHLGGTVLQQNFHKTIRLCPTGPSLILIQVKCLRLLFAVKPFQ